MPQLSKPGLAMVPRTVLCGLGLLVVTACHAKPAPDASQAQGLVVATIGSVTLTAADLDARIQRLPPFKRRRYAAPDQKRAFLEEQVRFEALAAEGMKHGLENDPDVQQALKQLVVTKLLERDFETKNRPENVPDADVKDYFERHPAEFRQKERVRALEIVVPDAETAARVEKDAAEGLHGNARAFASLAAKYSTDAATKTNGGDTGFFDRDGTALPKSVVDAAFALGAVGDVSEPVPVPNGFAVLMLAERRPGFERTLDEAKHDIQQRLFTDIRERALDAYVAQAMKDAKVERYPERLDAVNAAAAPSGAASVAPPAQSVSAR
jgi:peptidyl-prolyl cis-trans isomerase C